MTKDKAWKNVCAEANPDISESSAAGYQLRKHYQKHLLRLECLETGKDPEEALAFADKLKRQRRKDPPAQAAQAAVPPPQQQQAFPGKSFSIDCSTSSRTPPSERIVLTSSSKKILSSILSR